MPNKETCNTCKGTGVINALVSIHDDKKEKTICPTCKGKGHQYVMTDDEERDYYADYW